MNKIKISTAQFENRSGDKEYNLTVIERMAVRAAVEGSHVIAFHECSVTGYTFALHYSKKRCLIVLNLSPKGQLSGD